MMELDEIKSAWTSMDERLKKSEGLNERTIKEMLMQKSSKSLRKLSNYEIFSTITTFLLLPLLVHAFPVLIKLSVMHQFIIYFALGIAILATINQVYSMIFISKIDLHKEITENIKRIQQYKVYNRRGTIISTIVVSLFLLACLIAILLLPNKMEPWRWALVLIAVFGVWPLGVYWQYKKIYKANIQSILDSMEELKDLEE